MSNDIQILRNRRELINTLLRKIMIRTLLPLRKLLPIKKLAAKKTHNTQKTSEKNKNIDDDLISQLDMEMIIAAKKGDLSKVIQLVYQNS